MTIEKAIADSSSEKLVVPVLQLIGGPMFLTAQALDAIGMQ